MLKCIITFNEKAGLKLNIKKSKIMASGPIQFSSVQSLSHVQLFATPWIPARQASLSITNSRSSLKLTSIELVMPSSHLILCRPLLLLPPIPPSIRIFFNESTLRMRWPKYWSFSFSIIPSKEHPGLIFRMDWLNLLAVQGTLKSLLQCHSSKASILWHSAFFTVQLSHPYMSTGKTIALTRRTFYFMTNRRGNGGSSDRFPLPGKSLKSLWIWLQPWNQKMTILGRKGMINVDSVLKSRNITLPTKVCIVKAVVFSMVLYSCQSWTIRRQNTKELMLSNCGAGEDSLESLRQARRSNQSILREINPENSLKELMLKLKLLNFGHLIQTANSLEKSLMLGTISSEGEEGIREWDGWMASLMQWTWTWANSRIWWGTGRSGMLQSMGLQRVRHDWETEQQPHHYI